jgi:hypothetical protein
MSDSDFDSDGRLGAERKAPAAETGVHPTEGEILAELRARAMKRRVDVLLEPFPEGDLAFRIPMAHAVIKTCKDFISWIDELSGCQATSTGSQEDDRDAVG